MKSAWKTYGWGGALIVLLTVVAYLPAMKDGFVFDDLTLIRTNHLVKATDGLRRFWFTTEAADYYPLTWSLWWLEWRLWGDNPMGYHVVNILLHEVDAILVWLILRQLKIPGACMAALVFAVHPVNVATVAWVSEQKNTLSMFFYAVAILLYLRFDEEGTWHWLGFSLAAFLLALFSKSAVVMLPVVLLGCVWWRHERVRWKDILYSAPFFALSLVSGLVTIWFHHKALGETAIRTGGVASRLATAGWTPWFYLCKALLPIELMAIYPKWEIDASRWIAYLPGAILAGCFLVFYWRRKTWGRPVLFGLAYFVVMLFPVLGLFYQSFYRLSLVADHWQYYSIIGVIALVVAGAEVISRRLGEPGHRLAVVFGGIVLLLLVGATSTRCGVYANDEILWRDNLARNPGAWLAHYNLGVALQQAGDTRAAMDQWEQTLRINPEYAEARYNLGLALAQRGRGAEAMAQWRQALKSQPNMAEAHYNLGVALVQQGRVAEAMGHWEEALRIKPDYVEPEYNLGVALEQAGRVQEAISHYERAVKIRPDYAEAQTALLRLRTVP
jgi:tetratricopeptide (TPR) repeat protein